MQCIHTDPVVVDTGMDQCGGGRRPFRYICVIRSTFVDEHPSGGLERFRRSLDDEIMVIRYTLRIDQGRIVVVVRETPVRELVVVGLHVKVKSAGRNRGNARNEIFSRKDRIRWWLWWLLIFPIPHPCGYPVVLPHKIMPRTVFILIRIDNGDDQFLIRQDDPRTIVFLRCIQGVPIRIDQGGTVNDATR